MTSAPKSRETLVWQGDSRCCGCCFALRDPRPLLGKLKWRLERLGRWFSPMASCRSFDNSGRLGDADAEDAKEALPDDEAGQVIRLLLKFSSIRRRRAVAVLPRCDISADASFVQGLLHYFACTAPLRGHRRCL